MVYKKSDISQENLCYNIWYLNRNNCIVKNIFILCILLLGEQPRKFPQIFIHFTIFHSVSIFNWFISLVIVVIFHALLNIHVWLVYSLF